jgi:hydrogenase large subunit
MATVKIAPLNRLEGHLDIEATVDDSSKLVTHAQTKCVMFRGIENIMLLRDPRDAPIITQRV